MQLILMRHGLAVERDQWRGNDFSRPLTPEGRSKTREVAQGLAAFCPSPALIATSPKVRALQTAELAHEALKTPRPLETWPVLASDHFGSYVSQLSRSNAESVLLVGHEPYLSRFASYLLAHNADKLQMEWKKAGVMALELNLKTGVSTLLWMIPPRALKLLGKCANGQGLAV